MVPLFRSSSRSSDINSLSVEWKPRSLARLLSLPLKSAKMPSSLPWLSGNFNGSSKDGHMFEEPLWSEKKLPAITQVSLPLIIFNVHSVRLDIIIILNGIISRGGPTEWVQETSVTLTMFQGSKNVTFYSRSTLPINMGSDNTTRARLINNNSHKRLGLATASLYKKIQPV